MELSSNLNFPKQSFQKFAGMWEIDFVKFTGIGDYAMKFNALEARSRVRRLPDRISFSTLGEKEVREGKPFFLPFFFLFIFLFSF